MKQIEINNIKYEIVNDDYEIIDVDILKEMLTDYFEGYDYILGDQAYNKIRLKGFYESTNKNRTNVNDVKDINSYLKDYCAYGCKWFLLKKV